MLDGAVWPGEQQIYYKTKTTVSFAFRYDTVASERAASAIKSPLPLAHLLQVDDREQSQSSSPIVPRFYFCFGCSIQ